MDRFRISDRSTAEFLDNHKQQILYGKAGLTEAWQWDSVVAQAILIVVVGADETIVAPRIHDDFVVAPVQFTRHGTLTIERGDRFLVLV